MRADKCGRLWVLDTGKIDYLTNASKQIQPSQLVVYNLHNDNLIRRFPFPEDQTKKDSFFANIAIDDNDCDNSFAYCADMGSPGLIVYSYKEQKSWRVHHHYFSSDPLAGNYSINNITFQWIDGIFGLSLSKPQNDGFSTLYFHPLTSTNEFAVSTRVLRNETLATSDDIYRDFIVLGSRGPNGQSGASFLDQTTGVLFYTLPNLNAVACWKTSNRDYNIQSQGRVYMSAIEMVFPNDVKVDDQNRLWVLSDRLQEFIYSKLDKNDVNFRILSASVSDAISNTACDTTRKPLPEIISTLDTLLKTNNSTTTPSPNGGNSILTTSLLSLSLIIFTSILRL